MENRRKHKRTLMFDMLPVSLSSLGECIGHLVDITAVGMMIRSSCPVEVGSHFTIEVELREPVEGNDLLQVEGECVWCRRAPIWDGFNAGFQLTATSPQATRMIEALSRPPIPVED